MIHSAWYFLYAIYQALDDPSLPPDIRNKYMKSLYKMCARHTLFPTSLRITLCDNSTEHVLFQGGFGDVSRRKYQEQEVAVKKLRTYTTSDLQTIIHVGWRCALFLFIHQRAENGPQRFCKEFVPWKALRHPNVLPLLGIVMTKTEFAMVSEWMPNGNINQFVKGHQNANRFELVGFSPVLAVLTSC